MDRGDVERWNAVEEQAMRLGSLHANLGAVQAFTTHQLAEVFYPEEDEPHRTRRYGIALGLAYGRGVVLGNLPAPDDQWRVRAAVVFAEYIRRDVARRHAMDMHVLLQEVLAHLDGRKALDDEAKNKLAKQIRHVGLEIEGTAAVLETRLRRTEP